MMSFLFLVLATSTAALTLARSEVFTPLRTLCNENFPFIGKLLQCPYCVAHWVSLIFSALCWQWIPKVCSITLINIPLIALAIVPFTVPLMVMMYKGIPQLAFPEE